MKHQVLGIGIAGTELSALERSLLSDVRPYAVVLFARNVGTPEQLRKLVGEIKNGCDPSPLIMIDEEGGRVDRLRDLIPGIPAAEDYRNGENGADLAEEAGRLVGEALDYFGIDVNLAPVVDVERAEPSKSLLRRCFGKSAAEVIELAGAFMRGQESAGVASCLKHYPGLGPGAADPHHNETIIDEDLAGIAEDLAPYRALAKRAGAVMIGHQSYLGIDDRIPATLSRKISTDILRREIGFEGIAVSDDMEMHAVADLGPYPKIATQAIAAGNDVVLYCAYVEGVRDLAAAVEKRGEEDVAFGRRLAEAHERGEAYREHCRLLQSGKTRRLPTFDALSSAVADYHARFTELRPDAAGPGPGTTAKGKTGREEWT
ncbi:MAG: beta-N-acetylhexosaminidase [Thermoanaerobaculia bacterium]